MNLEQVRALAAIVDTGSFELAARTLHLTPSAISQRVRALESSVGQVVVRRVHPCTATEAGAVLVRLARQVELLEEESARPARGRPRGAARRCAIAINADSLDTWLTGLLDAAAGWEDTHGCASPSSMRTTPSPCSARGRRRRRSARTPQPVPGCRSFPLGVMRYLPVATPALAQRFACPSGEVDWEAMPVLRYDDHDHLQEQFLAARGWSPRRRPRRSRPPRSESGTARRAGMAARPGGDGG